MIDKKKSVVFVVIFSLLFSPAGCGPAKITSPSSLQADKSRYVEDLTFIAKAPRTLVDLHHQEVRDLCASRFTTLGYSVERYDFGDGEDVIGTSLGTTQPQEIVIVSAHYDTVMGGDGADDNASGVAAVLESARLLAGEKHKRTLEMACWDQEEPALTGSYLYATREKKKGTQIEVAYVYDEIGFTNDVPNSQKFPTGFTIVYPAAALKMQSNQYRANFILLIYNHQAIPWGEAIANAAGEQSLPTVQLEVNLDGKVPIELRGSDHSSFWGKGFSAIEITDTAMYRYPYQHSDKDTVDKLNNDFAVKVISAVSASVQSALNP